MRRLLVLLTLAACSDDAECTGEVGHDEDGDGIDDACDACPFASGDATDDDGDGIAGACDPDPASKQTVLAFAGFGDERDLTLTGGAIEDDAFHVTASGAALWRTPVDQVWIIAGIDVDRIDAAGAREVGIVVDGAPVASASLPNGTYCAVGEADVPDPGTDYIEVFTRQQPDADETIATEKAVLYLSGLKGAVIQASSARTALSCAFGVPGNRALITGTPATVAGQVGVFGAGVDAKFRFLYVLGHSE